MLAPPPGETFDSISEPKILPTTTHEDESSPEKVPLLTPAESEMKTMNSENVTTVSSFYLNKIWSCFPVGVTVLTSYITIFSFCSQKIDGIILLRS